MLKMATAHAESESRNFGWKERYQRKKIEFHSKSIVDKLVPSHITSLLPYIDDEEIRLKEETSSIKDAVRILLKQLLDKWPEGCFQGFIDALKNSGGYDCLVELLDDDSGLSQMQHFKSLETTDQDTISALTTKEDEILEMFIKLMEKEIVCSIHPIPICTAMFANGFLIEEDVQMIMAKAKTKTAYDANWQILVNIRRHKSGWYDGFLSVLHAEGYEDLVLRIEPQFIMGKSPSEKLLKPNLSDVLPDDEDQTVSMNEGLDTDSNQIDDTRRKAYDPNNFGKESTVTGPLENNLDCIKDKEAKAKAAEMSKVFNGLSTPVVKNGNHANRNDSSNAGEMKQESCNIEDHTGCNIENDHYDKNPNEIDNDSTEVKSRIHDNQSAGEVPHNGANADVCSGVQNSKDDIKLHLRDYQMELAEKPLKGINTIICAPTGSGKTRASLYVAWRHLEAAPRGERKIIFMAKKQPLARQQFQEYNEFLSKKCDYRVQLALGGEEDSPLLHLLIPEKDVIICTPQIIENHLREGQISCISNFSMLIFDECHHTTKDDPYNCIMYRYRKLKLDNKKVKLPQVLGLTASLGVGKSTNDYNAESYILNVMANLDCAEIAKVQKHVDQMAEYVNIPENVTCHVPARTEDPFYDETIKIMQQIETKKKKVPTATLR